MGRAVEGSSRPMAFIYCQGWQGFVCESFALEALRLCLRAEQEGSSILTPAENFILRSNPRDEGWRPLAMNSKHGTSTASATTATTEDAVDELLARSGAEAPRPGETHDQAVQRAFVHPVFGGRIEKVLRSKLAEMRAFHAHIETPDEVNILESDVATGKPSEPRPGDHQHVRRYKRGAILYP